MSYQTNKTNKWVFAPVHKSRVIKRMEKCVLIKISKTESCVLPNCFKRAKEQAEHIFFSLPSDFNIGIRTENFNKDTKSYEHTDKLYDIKTKASLIRMLSKPLEGWTSKEETDSLVDVATTLEDSPF